MMLLPYFVVQDFSAPQGFDPDGLKTKVEQNPAQAPQAPTSPATPANTTNPPATTKPQPSSALTQSAKTPGPKFGIGIEVPDPRAVAGGILNVDVDTGHTFTYVKDAQGNITAVHSFGPGQPIDPSNKNDFKNGKLSGNAQWPLHGKANVWEMNITPQQAQDATQAITDFKTNVPNYTPSQQCSSTSVDMAKAIGLNVPNGKGPVQVKYGPVTLYSDTQTNPQHLNEQMTKAYGPPAVINTSTLPKP